MKSKGIRYIFSNTIWQSGGPGSWYFVSLPEALTNEIRTYLKNEEQGWGRLSVTAQVGNTEWLTAIWFDTKRNTYLLPLKSVIRSKEGLQAGTTIEAFVYL